MKEDKIPAFLLGKDSFLEIHFKIIFLFLTSFSSVKTITAVLFLYLEWAFRLLLKHTFQFSFTHNLKLVWFRLKIFADFSTSLRKPLY